MAGTYPNKVLAFQQGSGLFLSSIPVLSIVSHSELIVGVLVSCCRVLSSGTQVGAAVGGEPLKVFIITETRGHPVIGHHILGVYRDAARAHGEMKKQFQERVLEWAKKEPVQNS